MAVKKLPKIDGHEPFKNCSRYIPLERLPHYTRFVDDGEQTTPELLFYLLSLYSRDPFSLTCFL